VSVVVTYRGPTAAAATGQYHADALARAHDGWVPVVEERHATRGAAELAVTFRRDRAAMAYIIETIEAVLDLARPVGDSRGLD